MDFLVVARESGDVRPTPSEIADPAEARSLLPNLPHGPQLASQLARLALGVMVLDKSLDRVAARSAIRVAAQRNDPKGVILLGKEVGRDLLGEGLPLTGGIRTIDQRPVAALGQAKADEIERLLVDLCQRAHLPWAPPSSRAVAARTVLRAEEAEAAATGFIERQQWAEAAEALRAGEPLGPRGTNMLGRALLQMGDREGARHAFERTLAADPVNAIAQRQLANLG